ncbi:MAG: diaminopimelate decarboxylase [Gemmatimonadaceae bacterium]
MGQSILEEPAPIRVGGVLHCEGVSLEDVAAAVGTPAYVYSASAITQQYRRLDQALAPVPHRIHYSAKANSNLAVLARLRELGAGVDVVSGGELHRAVLAGFRGEDIVFGGVGKTERELLEGLEAGVLLLNVESEAELRAVSALAQRRGLTAPVALRVNPEVTVDTPHPYTRTGERGMKFGLPYDEVPDVARVALSLPGVRVSGLDMHIGSQVSGSDPYQLGTLRLLELRDELRGMGAEELRFLDIGGGLPVAYDAEEPTDLEGFADAVLPLIATSGLTLIVEPGRFLVGNAGLLLTRVLYRKRSGGRQYVVTDAGMNDLLRPSHYNAYHRIEAVRERDNRITADIVGPVCESGDFFALGRDVEDVEVGDLLSIASAGAYGFVMASNYNSRPRAAEVLVDGDRYAVVRDRESYQDLTRHEAAEPSWRVS